MIVAHNADENGYWLLRSCAHEVMPPLNKRVRAGVRDCAP
jgi:hypothetical protein